jgi:hypothetical protein
MVTTVGLLGRMFLVIYGQRSVEPGRLKAPVALKGITECSGSARRCSTAACSQKHSQALPT